MATTTSTALSNRNRLLGFGLATLAAIGFLRKAILVKLAYYQPVDAVTYWLCACCFPRRFF